MEPSDLVSIYGEMAEIVRREPKMEFKFLDETIVILKVSPSIRRFL